MLATVNQEKFLRVRGAVRERTRKKGGVEVRIKGRVGEKG